ncbi:IclR family transcriptional regulator [Bordetella bronchiseptica]|uniref:IclR family transcriptional regulator n=1 Tax=Bordetella bronchiseptica TaxID=518 RepID=UPI0007882516|nr:IclR family transcriptional regulator [Bordetella bronchiseptica]MCE7075490.1 IclR family transcriptional regulator [Bordetella bronchiseptica]RFT75882.1 IclR family transcriptional regulator [Bordetella bronchiseptica]SUV62019.1 Transcriptional regulator kdgR [Bordetella bronchiseptica]
MGKTLVKGLHLLERLAASPEPMGITELAADLDLVQSNVHRLLQTLMESGYVQQDALTRRYRCTMRLWEMGTQIADRMGLSRIARPHMQALVKQSQETVHLAILDGADVLYIDKIDSPQPVRSYTRVGGRAPAYCTGTGKMLLAYCDDLAAALPAKLVKHTARSIASHAALKAELRRVREEGFSENAGEWREDVYGMGAPLFDATGKVSAAIGISGPLARMDAAVVARVRPMLQETARVISRELGYRG